MGAPVVWFQVNGNDGGKLRSFYGDLFGWQFQKQDYTDHGFVFPEGTGIPGGVGATEYGPAGVSFYVGVDDPEAYLTKAETLGGKCVVPPTRLPNGTTIALFADPEGNVIGISRNGA
jgi:predicted enzyme related to lactoylglutathione lyase